MTTHAINTNRRDLARFVSVLAVLDLCPSRYTASADRVEVWVPRPWLVDGTHHVGAYEHYSFPGKFLEGAS